MVVTVSDVGTLVVVGRLGGAVVLGEGEAVTSGVEVEVDEFDGTVEVVAGDVVAVVGPVEDGTGVDVDGGSSVVVVVAPQLAGTVAVPLLVSVSSESDQVKCAVIVTLVPGAALTCCAGDHVTVTVSGEYTSLTAPCTPSQFAVTTISPCHAGAVSSIRSVPHAASPASSARTNPALSSCFTSAFSLFGLIIAAVVRRRPALGWWGRDLWWLGTHGSEVSRR